MSDTLAELQGMIVARGGAQVFQDSPISESLLDSIEQMSFLLTSRSDFKFALTPG